MKWPCTKEQSFYLKVRRLQNIVSALNNPAEMWAVDRLRNAKLGVWHRQHLYGLRIFDFWENKKGVAIEIDGNQHNSDYDLIRDRFAFLRSGIIILRVKAFDEAGMDEALSHVCHIGTLKERRKRMGGNVKRKERTSEAGLAAHTNWSPKEKLTLDDIPEELRAMRFFTWTTHGIRGKSKHEVVEPEKLIKYQYASDPSRIETVRGLLERAKSTDKNADTMRRETGIWLIRKSSTKGKAHIWDKDDTVCRMASTGGLELSLFEIRKNRGEREICHMCNLLRSKSNALASLK